MYHLRSSLTVLTLSLLIAGSLLRAASADPLYVHPQNPRYFTHDGVSAVYLTGSHTWLNLTDAGGSYLPPEFDYTCWLDFLDAHNHNFFRLWTWEQAKWTGETSDEYYFYPQPFERTGPGTALDGRPRFDLTELNQTYFDRLRARVQAAANRGIYVAVVLFNGWSIETKGGFDLQNPWEGHPFNEANNINDIDGDVNNDNLGGETHELANPDVTAVQEAYVAKVIQTVNDFDNVLYEISNESGSGSQDWQYHMINFIKSVEDTLPKQHPVGMTVEYPGGSNSELFNSPADWISPNGGVNSVPVADGSKVILADTDHLCGICGDYLWVWRSFTRGENPIFMDQWDGAGYGVGALSGYDPFADRWVRLRLNMGYTLSWARRADLASMVPAGNLTSTDYCLANIGSEYIVFNPGGGDFTIDLSAITGPVTVEWRNLVTGELFVDSSVTGGSIQTLSPPFATDVAAYIYK